MALLPSSHLYPATTITSTLEHIFTYTTVGNQSLSQWRTVPPTRPTRRWLEFLFINQLWLLASAFSPPLIFLIKVLVSASPLLQLEQFLRVGTAFPKPL
jgi:hypothetical protein